MEDFARRFEELLPVIFRYIHKADSGDFMKMNLTFSQVMMLGLIGQKRSPKMKDLATELGVTLSNVTGMIDRLILSGYVKRYEDPSDRRVVRVKLTSKGAEIKARVSSHKKQCMERVFSKLSISDRSAIIRIMEKLAKEINTEGAEA